jgi:hypothetical protein
MLLGLNEFNYQYGHCAQYLVSWAWVGVGLK